MRNVKATIIVNRSVVAKNKKTNDENKYTIDDEEFVDNPAISVHIYQGVIYCKKVEFLPGSDMTFLQYVNPVLIQDARQADCSGATIWMEAVFEYLKIDDIPARLHPKTLELRAAWQERRKAEKLLKKA